MMTGNSINVRLESRNKIVVLREAIFLAHTPNGAIVKMKKDGSVVEVKIESIWICCECHGPAEMRFRDELWCLDCFEVVHNTPEPDRVENHVSMTSAIARAPETQTDVTGINASRFNLVFAKKMKKKKIPTMDPREWRSKVIAP